MYTPEQISELTLKHASEIAALWQSAKSAHKRIDDNENIAAGIHELAKNVATMATEIKLLTERVDKNIERIEQEQKAQGGRVGNIERAIMAIERSEKTIAKHEERLDAIEREPATKWKNFMWLVFAGVATAVIAYFMGKLQ